MEQEVEAAPFILNLREDSLKLARLANITGNDNRTVELLGERAHIRHRFHVHIGNREFRASVPKHPGTAIGDAVLIGDAEIVPSCR